MPGRPYNYLHFSAASAASGSFDGPKSGEKAPDFTAKTLEGTEVKLSDYFGKPIVLESCSITCPTYINKIAAMQVLVKKFPDTHFLLLYTREAHPGGKIRPHKLFLDKIKQARYLKSAESEIREILVDGVNGTAHRLYGMAPNFAYVIDKSANIVYCASQQVPERTELVLNKLQRNETITPSSIDNIPLMRPPALALRLRVFYRAGWRSLMDALLHRDTSS